MRLFIGIPAHDGRIDVRTMMSVQALVDLVRGAWGADAVTLFTLIGNSDVCSARDEIAYQFLASGADALLQVDTDVVFPAEKVAFLLNCTTERPLTGLTYPLKQIDAHNLKASGGELDLAVRFAFKPTFEVPAIDTQGFVEVEGFGAGCMLATRYVFEKMIERAQDRRFGFMPLYQSGAAKGPAGQRWGFFQRMLDPEGQYYGDDHAFCARWRMCGGSCFVLADATLEHVGPWAFRGNLATHLGAREGVEERVEEGTIDPGAMRLVQCGAPDQRREEYRTSEGCSFAPSHEGRHSWCHCLCHAGPDPGWGEHKCCGRECVHHSPMALEIGE